MAMRRVLTRLAAAAVLVVAVLASTGIASPVSAAGASGASTAGAADVGPASFDECPVGLMCVFALPNGFTGYGSWRSFRATAAGSCTWAGIYPWTGGVSGYRSVYNRTGVVQRLWTNSNCSGESFVIPNGVAIEDLGRAYWSVGGYP